MVLQLAFDVPDERTALFLGERYSGDLRKCGIVEGEYPIKRKNYETDAINCRWCDTKIMMGGVEVKLDTALVLRPGRLYQALSGSSAFVIPDSIIHPRKQSWCGRRGLGNVYRSVPRTFRSARSTGIYAVDLPDFVGKMQPKDPGLCSGQKWDGHWWDAPASRWAEWVFRNGAAKDRFAARFTGFEWGRAADCRFVSRRRIYCKRDCRDCRQPAGNGKFQTVSGF